MKVRAVARPWTTPQGAVGWDGIAVRYVGDIFDMPDGSTGTWFVPVASGAPGPVPIPMAFTIDV